MTQSLITDQGAFDDLCRHIREAGAVAFDTEFISEFSYRPELCLVQLATRERCVAVDPFEVTDLSAWWEIMADGQTSVVIHGGREEVRYCLHYAGRPPGNFWDVQVAEGLRGRSFPLGYDALVKRVLGRNAHGRETRTDWRRRPLTDQQIAYALDDVRHVLEIWDRQKKSLQSQQRLHWAEAEFQRMITEVSAERGPDAWMRLAGIQRLPRRDLAVVKAVHQWRENEASSRNRPVRKTLRDDLVIEVARRRPTTEQDLLACRDLNRPEYRKAAPQILEAIRAAVESDPSTWPELPKSLDDDKSHDEQVVGQLLGLALANRCAELNVAMGLVGKVADLRQLVRWHVYGERDGEPPRLTQGWRAEVCGDLLTQVLDGKISLRVADPQSDHPLVFEHRA
ncbi:MAG: HRDC domain-containing protein [Planctomycetaceae bacterium]|nr:HRDC domain-containing protein [Planctomycetaceae bacterium]